MHCAYRERSLANTLAKGDPSRDIHLPHVGTLDHHAGDALASVEHVRQLAIGLESISETRLRFIGSLRMMSSTWSSWYHRTIVGSCPAYNDKFGLRARNASELGIAMPAENPRRVFSIHQPVEVPDRSTGCESWEMKAR